MRIIAVIISILFMLGCQHVERPERPEDLISKEVMVDILTDVYLSNAAKSVNNKIIRQKGIKLDSFIYKKYDIDSVQFVRSHNWYNADLDAYKDIFIEIEQRLIEMQRKTDSLNFKPKSKIQKKQDSLRKARELIEPASSEG